MVMKLVLQVCVFFQKQLSCNWLLFLLLYCHFQEAGATAHLPLQQTPLHVVLDGFKQKVVLVHVPLFIGARRFIVVGLQFAPHLLLQRHVSQQAWHHYGLVHVVGSSDEAVHDVDEGVLVAGRVAVELHHLEGFQVELGYCWQVKLKGRADW